MLTIENNAQRRLSVWGVIKAQWQVLLALMLRDIASRWGSSIGFLMSIAWPLVHILILVLLFTGFGRIAPYGDSSILWFTVGMFPFMVFSYVSRFIVYGLISNKPLLVFPAIKITDILFSRMLIEVVNAGLVLVIIVIALWYLEIDFMPHDPKQAVLAVGVSVLLGLGLGMLNALLAAIMHMWVTGYALFVLLLWVTAGVLFVPSAMPEPVRDLLYFQPTVHLVEWLREAYYPEYNSLILDKTFIVMFSAGSVVLAMALERAARGRAMIN